MTGDKTQVDVEELVTFGRDAGSRSCVVGGAAAAVEGVHIGTDMLGPMFLDFAHNTATEQGELAAKLLTMVDVLAQDGEIAQANAKTAHDNETQQVDGFTQIEGS